MTEEEISQPEKNTVVKSNKKSARSTTGKLTKKNVPEKALIIELHDGEELSDEAAQKITGHSQTRLIVLAGDSESGKTTLLSAIYEKFLRGGISKFTFAGSQTLMGFEIRSWRSRLASNSSEADTDRTISGEQNLLHLVLAQNGEEQIIYQNILLLDISGEDYREARTSHEACLKLEKLKRADHLVLLIDGEKILDNSQRHEALRNSKQLLQRLINSKMLPTNPNVYILITKYDKIEPRENDPNINGFLENIENAYQTSFSNQVGNLFVGKIASRPRAPSTLKLGHGFDNFFTQWVEETPFKANVTLSSASNASPAREFDRYLYRDPLSQF